MSLLLQFASSSAAAASENAFKARNDGALLPCYHIAAGAKTVKKKIAKLTANIKEDTKHTEGGIFQAI